MSDNAEKQLESTGSPGAARMPPCAPKSTAAGKQYHRAGQAPQRTARGQNESGHIFYKAKPSMQSAQTALQSRKVVHAKKQMGKLKKSLP